MDERVDGEQVRDGYRREFKGNALAKSSNNQRTRLGRLSVLVRPGRSALRLNGVWAVLLLPLLHEKSDSQGGSKIGAGVCMRERVL